MVSVYPLNGIEYPLASNSHVGAIICASQRAVKRGRKQGNRIRAWKCFPEGLPGELSTSLRSGPNLAQIRSKPGRDARPSRPAFPSIFPASPSIQRFFSSLPPDFAEALPACGVELERLKVELLSGDVSTRFRLRRLAPLASTPLRAGSNLSPLRQGEGLRSLAEGRLALYSRLCNLILPVGCGRKQGNLRVENSTRGTCPDRTRLR